MQISFNLTTAQYVCSYILPASRGWIKGDMSEHVMQSLDKCDDTHDVWI